MSTMPFARRARCLLPMAWLCASAGMPRQGLSLSVDDPRPLAAAVATLEDKLGWAVTYEDPPYLHPGDSQDVTLTVVRSYQPGQRRVLVPRGGPFTFVEPPHIRSSAAQEPEVLQALLDQYAGSGYPATFALRRTESVFHVVPTAIRNAQGAQQACTSILDQRVSQGAGTRTAMEAIEALAAQTGLSVGRSPTGLLRGTALKQNAAQDTARNLLLGILKATNRQMSWRLLCDPGGTRFCVLNIRIVGMSPFQRR